jgi:D-alanyl-D-alanine-carboxypeptidase/D-alanyl-D-alanine-endopeptidase
MMRRRDVIGLLAAAALPSPRPARASQALLDESVGFAGQVLFLALKVPALVLGVVRNGQTSIQGFGRRADSANEAPGADTLFRIGSVTKAFTGQVLASLAADGMVSLADPLTKYAPEFIAPISEGGRPIRLIDLATHSAGLPREVPHEPGPPDDPFVNITPEAFTAWLKANPLLFTPGTSISYSNFGFDLLAAALARAAHQPYPNLLDARITRPLGLRDTTFAPSTEQAARIMQGRDFDGSPMPNAKTGEVIVGSGGLYSTARDLLAWLQWHLDRFSNDRADERLIDHGAYLWRDGLNAVFGMDESGRMDAMGLAWVIMAPEGDRPLILQKAGGLQGVFSYVAFAPARGIGVCAAINAFDFAAGLAMAKSANDLIAELAPR